MTTLDAADEFLARAKAADPEHYEELERRFPLSTEYDDYRFRHGEPRGRRLKRIGPSGGIPRHWRRIPTEDEKQARRAGVREHELDYALAKELAQQGM